MASLEIKEIHEDLSAKILQDPIRKGLYLTVVIDGQQCKKPVIEIPSRSEIKEFIHQCKAF